MRTLVCTAAVSAALTMLTLAAPGWTPQAHAPGEATFENTCIRVSEIVYAPNQPRPRYTRATDQALAFLDDCAYPRIDSQTGAKEIRKHQSGDVIWENKCEDAPALTNIGNKA